MSTPTHYVTRTKRYTKEPDGTRRYGWSLRATREEYNAKDSFIAFTLDIEPETIRRIEGLIYAR